MANLLGSYEKALIEKVKSNDKSAFTVIFTNYYPDLVRFSFTFTRNQQVSEELVQEIFLKLWEDRNSLEIQTSLKSFLLKSVQNSSIDWLRHLNIQNKHASIILNNPLLSENETENYVLHSELESNFGRAMKKLPAQHAEVFRMSRSESLTYSEISDKLGISVRTVKDRISKVLLILKEELKDYLPESP
jgi:RNA polymerase sigma-70 factor (family 1)